jgi:hypothetical protein
MDASEKISTYLDLGVDEAMAAMERSSWQSGELEERKEEVGWGREVARAAEEARATVEPIGTRRIHKSCDAMRKAAIGRRQLLVLAGRWTFSAPDTSRRLN